ARMLGGLPALLEGRPLRWLGIGDGEIEDHHIGGLRAAMPGLEGLGVLTSKPTSALRGLAGMKDIEIASHELGSAKLIDRIYKTQSPELERLVVHGMSTRITASAFEPILNREVFPKLRQLGVFGPH